MSLMGNNKRVIQDLQAANRNVTPERINPSMGSLGSNNTAWARIVELKNDYLMCIPSTADPEDETLVPFPVAKLPELRHEAPVGLIVTTVNTNHIQVTGELNGATIEEDWKVATHPYSVGSLIKYEKGVVTLLQTDDEVPVTITAMDLNVAHRVWAAEFVSEGE